MTSGHANRKASSALEERGKVGGGGGIVYICVVFLFFIFSFLTRCFNC